jgi:hypothetical protein
MRKKLWSAEQMLVELILILDPGNSCSTAVIDPAYLVA